MMDALLMPKKDERKELGEKILKNVEVQLKSIKLRRKLNISSEDEF